MRWRTRVPLRTAAAAAAALALAAGVMSGATAAGSAGPVTTPPASTPRTSLQAAWQDALAAAPQMRSAAVSAYAYDLTTGRPLAAIHPDWRLTPASVNKLFTSAAALNALGPNFRYTTTVRTGARTGGAIYLVGGGDPWLEADGGRTLEAMARAVAAKVRSATRVIGVSTAFGPTAPGTAWPIGNLPYAYAAPISALTSGRDEVHIVVSPGATAGDPARVAVNPYNPSARPPTNLLSVADRAVTGPAGAPDSVGVRAAPGTNAFTVTGVIPLGAPALDDYLTLARPVLVTAATFEAILQADGVRFGAAATTGALPVATRTLLVHRSKPLAKYLQVQNTFSVNSMAESLFRYLGVARSGVGTAATAQAAMTSFLQKNAIATDSVHLDGSGLSPDDEASAADVVALLAYSAHQPWFSVFEHSLIHIGRTDQCSFLCGLMDNTAADGTVWLKTGNLDNQWNYAGYAHARNGDLIAFAILMDGLAAGRYFQAAEGPIDAMTVAAASYPSKTVPAPAARVPDAAVPALPPALRRALGPLTAADVVGAAMVQVAGPGSADRTVWQTNGGVRLMGGLLPRLAVALAALTRHADAQRAEILSTGQRQGSTLRGALVLAGRWDPNVTDATLASLARQVAATGIRRVTGPLEAVAGPAPAWAGTAAYPPDLPWEIASGATAPPISPLAVDQDQVGILVRPDARGQATASVVPAGAPVGVSVDPGGPSSAASGLEAVWQPGTDAFVVAGRVDAPAPQTVTVSAPDPAAVAAVRLRADLATAGVSVAGTVVVGRAVAGTVLAAAPSAALLPVAEASLTAPSGFLTLDLYGLLGHAAAGDVTAELGPLADVPDPAGLGSGDYLTAASVAAMLAHAYAQGGPAGELARSLARPWSASTLEGRTVVGLLTVGERTYAYCLIANGLLPNPVSVAQLSAVP